MQTYGRLRKAITTAFPNAPNSTATVKTQAMGTVEDFTCEKHIGTLYLLNDLIDGCARSSYHDFSDSRKTSFGR